MNDSENQVIRERFNELKSRLEGIENEDINLDEAGIKELNNKISVLIEMENDVKSLVRVSTEKYNDQELLEYTSLMGEVKEYITSLNAISDRLKDAQRSREKLRNKLTDESKLLTDKRTEFDYKISDTNEKLEVEKQVLELDLSNVDREYHESLLNVYGKYVDALNEERKPLDEKYNSYSQEIDRLVNGGSLYYQLNENGDLVEKEAPEIKEIELPKEDVILPNDVQSSEDSLPAEPLVDEENTKEDAINGLEVETDEVPEVEDAPKEVINPLNIGVESVVDETSEIEKSPEEVVNPLNDVLEPVADETTEFKDTPKEVVNPSDDYSNFEPSMVDKLPPLESSENSFDLDQFGEMFNSTEDDLSEETLGEKDSVNNFGDTHEEVTNVKDATPTLLTASGYIRDEVEKYMESVKKPENNVETEKEDKKYQLKEGETLTAEVSGENGEPNKIEIDFDGNKKIINPNGEISTGRAVLDERVNEKGEKVMEVGPEDLELNFELPDLSALSGSQEPMDEEGPKLTI